MNRHIYIDESGTSHNEPVMVVAGVVVKGNRQWRDIQRYLNSLIERYVHEEDRKPWFAFHATELFHGKGKVFGHRDRYPLERSREALKAILAIPAKFHLPVVYGVEIKETPPADSTRAGRRLEAQKGQAKTFALCVLAAESYMITSTSPNSVATLVAEKNTDTEKAVAWMHQVLQGKVRSEPGAGIFSVFSEMTPGRLPLTRIVDDVHFTRKGGAPFLQIADACAFIIRHHFEKKPYSQEYVKVLTNDRAHVIDFKSKGAIGGWGYLPFPRIACVHYAMRVFYTLRWQLPTLIKTLSTKWRELRAQNQ